MTTLEGGTQDTASAAATRSDDIHVDRIDVNHPRSPTMQALYAELARSHPERALARDHVLSDRRLARAVLAHRRAQRKAEASALRARQLLALAVVR